MKLDNSILQELGDNEKGVSKIIPLQTSDEQYIAAVQNQMVDDGKVMVDEYGDAHLTDKGRRQYMKLLDRMTNEEKIILQVGLANDHGTPIHF